jgi:hypothetical protein
MDVAPCCLAHCPRVLQQPRQRVNTVRPGPLVDGRAVLSFIAVKEAGLRSAAVASALNVTARAAAGVLPLGARLARERDMSLAKLQIDAGDPSTPRCAAPIHRPPSP